MSGSRALALQAWGSEFEPQNLLKMGCSDVCLKSQFWEMSYRQAYSRGSLASLAETGSYRFSENSCYKKQGGGRWAKTRLKISTPDFHRHAYRYVRTHKNALCLRLPLRIRSSPVWHFTPTMYCGYRPKAGDGVPFPGRPKRESSPCPVPSPPPLASGVLTVIRAFPPLKFLSFSACTAAEDSEF